MKVHKRPYPLNALVAEEKGIKVAMFTHHSKIIVTIKKDGKPIHDLWVTLPELASLLMRDAR